MKKIYGILAAAGILLAMIPVSAVAYPANEFGQDVAVQEKAGFQQQIRQQPKTAIGALPADAPQKYVKRLKASGATLVIMNLMGILEEE